MPEITKKLTAQLQQPPNPAVQYGPWLAAIMTVVIYFLSQILGSLILLAVASQQGYSGAGFDTWAEQTGVQFVYIVIIETLAVGLLWFVLGRFKASFYDIGLRRPSVSDLGYSLAGFAVYLPAVVLVMTAVKLWFPGVNLDQQQDIGFQAAQGSSLILVFISLVILPPIVEELLMRGFLYTGLRTKLKVGWAALITSLLFATAHLQLGNGAPLVWAAAIDTFILSMVLVWLREKTGKLWAPIGLHMIKNSIAFASLFLIVK